MWYSYTAEFVFLRHEKDNIRRNACGCHIHSLPTSANYNTNREEHGTESESDAGMGQNLSKE